MNEVYETRKIARLTFEPAVPPNDVVQRSYSRGAVSSASPFVRLRPPADQDRIPMPRLPLSRVGTAFDYVAVPAPSTRWYPDKNLGPTIGNPLNLNLESSMSSPRATARVGKRKQVLNEVLQQFPGVEKSNISTIMFSMLNEMNSSGELTPVMFTNVLKEMHVDDVATIDTVFQLIDVKKCGALSLMQVIAVIQATINGPQKEKVRRACFQLFNLDDRGYIHKSHLDMLKAMKDPIERHETCTPHMVKVLSDLFVDIRRVEEDNYIGGMTKGKGKKKAPPLRPNQASIIPLTLMRISHIDFKTFDGYFSTSPDVAVAFSKVWIGMLETDAALREHVVEQLQLISSLAQHSLVVVK